MYAVDVDNFIQLNSVLTGTTDANATVKGNILFDNTITASAHTYLLESSSNFTLSSNGTFRGIDISSTTGFDIENLTMAGFSVVGRGGAIYGNALPDGTRTISNSYFLNNRSTDLGGAIYFLGTGTLKLDIRSTEFRNNRSTGSDGGAIRVGSAAQLEIADSFFIENEASASGGAIDYRGGNGNARRLSTIKNTEFKIGRAHV